MKASYKMKQAIKRLEKKYGPCNVFFDETPDWCIRFPRCFYSSARAYSPRFVRGYVDIFHDGSINFYNSEL